jgi:uncharacterized protein (UPF0261 family)
MSRAGKILAGCLLAAALAAAPAGAQAPEPYVGRTVQDAKGAELGQVAQVIRDAQGRPVQVLVQPRGRLLPVGFKSLPVASLTPQGEALRAPLLKAEFEAMPIVQAPRS